VTARDRKLKQDIEVANRGCPKKKCYVPGYRPVGFSKGQGYRGESRWVCVHREHHGCPPPERQ
jgi:hypothetical protein